MLTVVRNPLEGGVTEKYPDKAKYPSTDNVTLTAFPSAGFVFDNWSGQTEGIVDLRQNPVSFLMGDRSDNNRVITANFARSHINYSVTTIIEPTGGGSITFQPDWSDFPINQVVTVYADENEGYTFSHWVGDVTGVITWAEMTMNGNKAVTAVFNPTVSTYCSPFEAGSVDLEPAQPSDGYAAGTEVTITATAAKGYRFASWEGDVSGSDTSITVTVDTPKTITATFVVQSPSRWWLWLIVGLVGLFGALILLRLVFARMNRGVSDEPPQPDE